jgi:hypothetical protein
MQFLLRNHRCCIQYFPPLIRTIAKSTSLSTMGQVETRPCDLDNIEVTGALEARKSTPGTCSSVHGQGRMPTSSCTCQEIEIFFTYSHHLSLRDQILICPAISVARSPYMHYHQQDCIARCMRYKSSISNPTFHAIYTTPQMQSQLSPSYLRFYRSQLLQPWPYRP